MIEIRRLSTCSFEVAVQLWNEGFQGYIVDMTQSLDSYLARITSEDLSLSHSLVAFIDGQPGGFVLNGIRACGETKVAWNGGTGVIPKFRGKGVGSRLVEAAVELYAQEGVDRATLEALSGNEAAISLYRKFDYEVIERLILLYHEGSISGEQFRLDGNYHISPVSPYAIGALAFYRNQSAWQVQWQSVLTRNGQGVIATDARGMPVGYALFKQILGDDGTISAITLYQCEASDSRPDAEQIVAFLLEHVYSPLERNCLRNTSNVGESNVLVRSSLERLGFETFVEQVHMLRT